MQRADARGHVIGAHKLRMLARDQQQVAEALRVQRPRLAPDLLHRERHAQDRVIA